MLPGASSYSTGKGWACRPRFCADQDGASLRRLDRKVPQGHQRHSEIVEAHRLTGNYDYIVKVVLPRVEHYDVVYKQIVRKVELFDVSASISMEVLKSGTAVPVGYAE